MVPRVLPLLTVIFIAAIATPTTAQAQGENRSRWGVSFSGTPKWDYAPFILSIGEKIGGSPIGDFDVHGGEWSVGFVRGSDNGGDWGVSLVKRSISDDSIFREHIGGFSTPTPAPGQTPPAVLVENYHTFNSASVTGVEIHKYSPYLRTRWVQVGLTTAIGFAKISGTSTEHSVLSDGTSYTYEDTAARAFNRPLLWGDKNTTPIGRVELTAGIRATDRLKVKVGGGLSFPGTSVFRVGVNYLF